MKPRPTDVTTVLDKETERQVRQLRKNLRVLLPTLAPRGELEDVPWKEIVLRVLRGRTVEGEPLVAVRGRV